MHPNIETAYGQICKRHVQYNMKSENNIVTSLGPDIADDPEIIDTKEAKIPNTTKAKVMRRIKKSMECFAYKVGLTLNKCLAV